MYLLSTYVEAADKGLDHLFILLLHGMKVADHFYYRRLLKKWLAKDQLSCLKELINPSLRLKYQC